MRVRLITAHAAEPRFLMFSQDFGDGLKECGRLDWLLHESTHSCCQGYWLGIPVIRPTPRCSNGRLVIRVRLSDASAAGWGAFLPPNV